MSDTPAFRPRSICFKVVEPFQNFFDWRPDRQPFDKFNVALTPLRRRPALGYQRRLMHCHDMQNGYVAKGDLWPQGSPDADTYNFAYWQHVDVFCYFAHRRITIPTPWFINAAHQNGVPVLGTVLFEDNSHDDDFCRLFVKDRDKALDQLTALATHYGFDGWLFNLECSLPTGVQVKDITDFLSELRSRKLTVIWYDALTANGNVEWQNCLNQLNNVFFQASNGILTNYWLDGPAKKLQTSACTAHDDGRSPLDVYTGVDVFRGGGSYGEGFDCVKIFDDICTVNPKYPNPTAVGFYAPAWTYEQASGDGEAHHQDYEKREAEMWVGEGAPSDQKNVAQFIPPIAVAIELPFATNFDRGRGFRFAVRGQEVSTQQWSNLSLQGIQPTNAIQAIPENNLFAAEITSDSSWDGGAALRIKGQAVSQGEDVVCHLFALLTVVEGAFSVKVVFRPLKDGATFPAVKIFLNFDDRNNLSFQTANYVQEGGGWLSFTARVDDPSRVGKMLTQISLNLPSATNTSEIENNYGIEIGAVTVLYESDSQAPNSVQALQGWAVACDGLAEKGVYLTWNYPNGAARFYDIWQLDVQEKWNWLARVCANAALLENAAWADAMTFGVQPISPGLVEQPLKDIATFKLDLSGGRFDDSGTTQLFAGHICQLDVYSDEDMFYGFQSTIKHRPLTTNAGASDPGDKRLLPLRGGAKGVRATVKFADDEHLLEIIAYYGQMFGQTCLVELTFGTNLDKYSYGDAGGGGEFVISKAPPGQQIIAFEGYTASVSLPDGSQTEVITKLVPVFGDLT